MMKALHEQPTATITPPAPWRILGVVFHHCDERYRTLFTSPAVYGKTACFIVRANFLCS